MMPVDYMHCVLLGVVKKIVTLWLNSTFHKEMWNANIQDSKYKSCILTIGMSVRDWLKLM